MTFYCQINYLKHYTKTNPFQYIITAYLYDSKFSSFLFEYINQCANMAYGGKFKIVFFPGLKNIVYIII